MFKSIPYVIHFVTDAPRSLEFYTRVLGLPVKANYDDIWIELDAGNIVLALHAGQKRPLTGPGDAAYAKFSFGVASVSAAIGHLVGHGVKLDYPPNEVGPGHYECAFRDPDNIPIGIYGPK